MGLYVKGGFPKRVRMIRETSRSISKQKEPNFHGKVEVEFLFLEENRFYAGAPKR